MHFLTVQMRITLKPPLAYIFWETNSLMVMQKVPLSCWANNDLKFISLLNSEKHKRDVFETSLRRQKTGRRQIAPRMKNLEGSFLHIFITTCRERYFSQAESVNKPIKIEIVLTSADMRWLKKGACCNWLWKGGNSNPETDERWGN